MLATRSNSSVLFDVTAGMEEDSMQSEVATETVVSANEEAATTASQPPPAAPVASVPPASKMSEYMRKAVAAAVEYNQMINQERKERAVCMDLQTCTTHYPIGLGGENRQLQRNIKTGRVRGKIGKYPVALVSSQYQDWYVKYTSDELKYFPLNTVLFGPVSMDPAKAPVARVTNGANVCDSSCESEDSDGSGHSCCSSDAEGHREDDDGDSDDSGDSSSSSSCDSSSNPSQTNGGSVGVGVGGVGVGVGAVVVNGSAKKSTVTCKECKKSSRNKLGRPEQLVRCSECGNSCHPGCLELSSEMGEVMRSYAWQCPDCKSCVTCKQSTDEETLMFCDKCDRGYHTRCVGLKSIPSGKWICKLCAKCAVCGSTHPAGLSAQLDLAQLLAQKEKTEAAARDSALRKSSRVSAAAAAAAQAAAAAYEAASSNPSEWQHETIKLVNSGKEITRHTLLCQVCYAHRRK